MPLLMFQRLHSVLGHGATPAEAVEVPMVAGLAFSETVLPGTLDEAVLEAAADLGTVIGESDDSYNPAWVGVDLLQGERSGAVELWLEEVGGGTGATE